MTPGSGGSNARVMASSTELTIFTQRICKAEMGSVSPSNKAVISTFALRGEVFNGLGAN